MEKILCILHIVEREIDCQHLYTLHFDLEFNALMHWVLNNGMFLEDVIANYKLKAQDILLEAKAKENRVVRPSYHTVNWPNKKFHKLLHKNLEIPVFLSAQQGRCLILLIQGKPVKQIASEMGLSPRTVESYLERIRDVLGCATSKELIAHYYGAIIKTL